MTDIVKVRNEAIQLAKEACEYDDKKEYEDAYKCYKKAAEKLKFLMTIDENKYNQETYRNKALEYAQRATALKDHQTKTEEEKKQPVPSGGDGDKKDKDGKDDPDAKLKESLASCVVSEKPNVKWSDVAGLHKAKEALQEAVILPLKFPQLFVGKVKPWKGILLYGPPGTGKSYLASACATESAGTFYSLSAANIVSKWMGESERLVKSLFELARKTKPSVIFIDEIDSLLSARVEGENDSTKRVKTQFLIEMQGVGHDDTGILVLGATNIPWDLDPAVRRRFQKKIYIPLPEEEARLGLLKLSLGKDTPNSITPEQLAEIASMTEGFSGSDISNLVQDAVFEPIRKCQGAKFFKKIDGFYIPCAPSDDGSFKMSLTEIPEPDKLKPPIVCQEDVIKAMSKIKATVSAKDLIRQEEFTQEFGQEG